MEPGKRGDAAVLKWAALVGLVLLLAAYDPAAVTEFLPLAAATVHVQVALLLVKAGVRRRKRVNPPAGRLRLSH
jgi:uncharacterized membrane protein YdfJ with MMPL/SSD domain